MIFGEEDSVGGQLRALTWLDVLYDDSFNLTPFDKDPSSKFWPIIDPDLLRATAIVDNGLQHFYHLIQHQFGVHLL